MNSGRWIVLGFVLCGCAGRTNVDLLQARIREQSIELTESQRQTSQARSELKRANLQLDELRSQLAQSGEQPGTATSGPAKVSRVYIFPLASGGLNKDDEPGDDAVVIQFAPMDSDNEPVKIPGRVQVTLLDPRLPESGNEIGVWEFSSQEVRDHWTRGLMSSGYQFTLPLKVRPEHSDLVVKLQFELSKDRRFEATQIVKVVTSSVTTARHAPARRKQEVRVVHEIEDSLPEVAGSEGDAAEVEWEDDDRPTAPTATGRAVLHSSNWTDATIPVIR